MSHPSFGALSPEQFKTAQAAPFGGAKEIIQRIDPLWGSTAGDADQMKKYRVEIRAIARIVQKQSAAFEVTAENQEAAEKVALELADRHDFDFDQDTDHIDYEISDTERI